jgi:hypothetical protein
MRRRRSGRASTSTTGSTTPRATGRVETLLRRPGRRAPPQRPRRAGPRRDGARRPRPHPVRAGRPRAGDGRQAEGGGPVLHVGAADTRAEAGPAQLRGLPIPGRALHRGRRRTASRASRSRRRSGSAPTCCAGCSTGPTSRASPASTSSPAASRCTTSPTRASTPRSAAASTSPAASATRAPTRRASTTRASSASARGWVYFRGSESEDDLDSVDADVLCLDEFDRLKPANIPVAERRVSGEHSLGLIRRVGVPSMPNFGIDLKYRESDRRQWLVKCGCGEEQPMTWERQRRP